MSEVTKVPLGPYSTEAKISGKQMCVKAGQGEARQSLSEYKSLPLAKSNATVGDTCPNVEGRPPSKGAFQRNTDTASPGCHGHWLLSTLDTPKPAHALHVHQGCPPGRIRRGRGPGGHERPTAAWEDSQPHTPPGTPHLAGPAKAAPGGREHGRLCFFGGELSSS